VRVSAGLSVCGVEADPIDLAVVAHAGQAAEDRTGQGGDRDSEQGDDAGEDAVQDGFVDAWVNLPQFRHQASVHTWLFRLTANRVLKERRRRRPVPVDDRLLASQPDTERRTPEATAEHAQLWQTLDLALGELPWRQRASWMLRELEGLGYDDIAKILDTTPTVVRGQLHRARRALAIRMEQWR